MANIRGKRPLQTCALPVALAQNGAFPPEPVYFLILSVEAAPLVNGQAAAAKAEFWQSDPAFAPLTPNEGLGGVALTS